MDAREGYRLEELVARFGGALIGDPQTRIRQVAALDRAGPDQLSFFTSGKYRAQLAATRAGAVVLAPEFSDAVAVPRIVSADPYAWFARVAALLNPPARALPGIHPSASIAEGASVAASACVEAHAQIGRDAKVGEGCWVGGGCVVGEGATLGAGTRLYPGVVVYAGCVIGQRVIVHSGAVIGADGFGYAEEGGRWLKIPQIGRVVVGDDAEIGACTTIDRGALGDTVIGEGVKLDNQIQVAHNVTIGAHTAVAGCVGIAGSTHIGAGCRIGGAAMIIGHLEICDGVEISAGTFVARNIERPGKYTSVTPLLPHRDWLRNAAQLRHLDELAQRLRRLEQELDQLKGGRS